MPERSHKIIRKKPKRLDRILGVAAVVTIVIAWFVGYSQENANIESFLQQALPQADSFEKLNGGDTYAAFMTNSAEEVIGYVSVGEATGYGGPMKVAIATDLEGNVTGLSIIEQRETPSWYNRVVNNNYIDSLLGKSYADSFELDNDVDGVSGATYTSRAIADAVRQGSREIAAGELGKPVPSETAPQIQFGIPEIVLIALFAVGFVGTQRKFKYTKQIRWASMLIGLVVLGFIYTRPLTLSMINQMLLGFWPQWQTNLYWYLLLGGILFVFTVDNKNPYCQWFCPFGAAQECMGAIGGGKVSSPQRYRNLFKWLQRGLVWLAIVLALIFRNPGLTSYEIFGTLFDLQGSTIMFVLLGLVLVISLFVRRPWCRYLCPLRPVDEFIKMIRGWILDLWRKIKPKPAGSVNT